VGDDDDDASVTAGQDEEAAKGGLPLSSSLYRDPEWERAEKAYLMLCIENLNKMARAYNLMAPDLAKKPYYSLERELLSAYADVAPQLADEIKQRATRPTNPGLGSAGPGHRARGGMLGSMGGTDGPRIHLEADEKAYGLKEWWRDVWTRKK